MMRLSRSDVGEFRRRFKWLAVVVGGAFLLVLLRLFQLQILQGDTYAAMARENIVRRKAITTTRGVIRDAHGKIVANSRSAYNVHVVPGRVLPSARGTASGRSHRDEVDTWPRIADTLRLNPKERSQFEERIRAACANEYSLRKGKERVDARSSPCWRAILVREDVPRDIIAEIRQHESELIGTEIVSVPVRYYPFRNLGAHAIGYVQEINAETLSEVRPEGYAEMTPEEKAKVNPLSYEVGDTLGATGIEHAWESYLRGQRGWEKRVVDARGHYHTGPNAERLLSPPIRQDAVVGRNLNLTLDMELTQSIQKAMRPHLSGAVVVVEVRTGRLLAMYSKPDFDPNDISGGSGRARVRETFGRLSLDPLRPLLDKSMSGAFQPGSTFKPFSALAALEDKVMNPEDRERCDGYLHFGRKLFRCTHVHGRVNMREALAGSCNIYFAKVAELAGMDRIARVAQMFGFGSKTGLGINPEAPGRIPTRAWYAARYRGQFRLGFTINTAIGQGATTATPLQLAMAYAALANGGTLFAPQVIRSVATADGSVVQSFDPKVRQTISASPENMNRILDGLHAVVNDKEGTAYPVRDPSMEVAGKTGTAQTGYVAKPDDDPKLAGFYSQTHAWFAAFYPARAPEVAVVVLAEHGGSGPTQAAPVAMQVLREYRRIRGQKGPDFPAKTSRPSVPGEEQPGEDAQTMPSPSDPTTEATSPAVPPIPPADPGHENGTDLTDPVDEESP